MSRISHLVKDPVCDMLVDAKDNTIEYQHHQYAFCSLQCKERFLANPHLYIGQGGHKAPKQEGHSCIKKRRIKLKKSASSNARLALTAKLREMMGVEKVRLDGDHLDISYDLLQLTERQIETEMSKTGALPSNNLFQKLRRIMIQYSEQTELENLESNQDAGGHNH